MSDSDKRTRISVQIEYDDLMAIQRYATSKRVSISDVVREALIMLIAKVKGERK